MTRLRTKAALGLALAALVFAGGRQLLGSFAPHSAGHPPPNPPAPLATAHPDATTPSLASVG